ncbi:uncharacterized protein LOC144364561 [Saccoglossus kowalevskii]
MRLLVIITLVGCSMSVPVKTNNGVRSATYDYNVGCYEDVQQVTKIMDPINIHVPWSDEQCVEACWDQMAHPGVEYIGVALSQWCYCDLKINTFVKVEDASCTTTSDFFFTIYKLGSENFTNNF